MKTITLLALAAALIYIPGAMASDIAREVRNAGESPLTEDGGYFEIGIVAGLGNQVAEQKNPEDNDNFGGSVGITLNGEYRYKGLFFEASQGSVDGLNFGYTLWNNNTWQLDFLAASVSGGYSTDNDINEDDTEQQRNEKLVDRNTFYTGTGFRITGYLEDYIIQYRLVTDTFDSNGFETSLRFGKHWQYRNWNFHGVVGGDYTSAKAGRYLWGIKADEASERFTAYEPGASVELQAELGLSYPINENLVFRTTARYTHFSDEKSNSPYIKDDHSASLFTTLTYVF